jgi:molybdopterin-guanine dinucleotide biosynthesis adapter protein
MGAVKVLQIVGFKNSGKTELMLHLLGIAKESGLMVSTIKHHGHGGEPEMPPASTDSMRFFEHGAASSLVYGGGVVQLHQRKEAVELDDLVRMAQSAAPGLVLVEGFKDAGHEKIVLIRSEEDWEELKKLKRIALVIAPKSVRLAGAETLERDERQKLKNWFFEWMEGGTDESI